MKQGVNDVYSDDWPSLILNHIGIGDQIDILFDSVCDCTCVTVSNDWQPTTTSFASSSSTGDSLTSIVLSIRPAGASSGALPSNRSNRAPAAGRRARLTGSNLDHSFFVKSLFYFSCV